MIEVVARQSPEAIHLRLHGVLSHKDIRSIEPALDELVKREGDIKALVDVRDLKAAGPRAALADLKLGAKYYNRIECLAIVGNKRWHRWLANMARPFTLGRVKYFSEDSDAAWAFLHE